MFNIRNEIIINIFSMKYWRVSLQVQPRKIGEEKSFEKSSCKRLSLIFSETYT